MSQATTLTSKEIKRVIQAIKLSKYAVRDLTIFYFGLYSGLSAKELASLRVSNVYFVTSV
jgi:integrase